MAKGYIHGHNNFESFIEIIADKPGSWAYEIKTRYVEKQRKIGGFGIQDDTMVNLNMQSA